MEKSVGSAYWSPPPLSNIPSMIMQWITTILLLQQISVLVWTLCILTWCRQTGWILKSVTGETTVYKGFSVSHESIVTS